MTSVRTARPRPTTGRGLRRAVVAPAALALALGLAACGTESDAADGESSTGEDETSISVAVPPSGWDEGIAVSYLWKQILEDEGYDVDMRDGADNGIIYTALAGGDFDVYFDAWLPLTHASYLETYGDQITELGTWYDDAKLTIAVNEDSPARSLEDLATMAGEYGNRLVGIEAGAGLTEVTQDAVIPTYGLEGMDYVISSTSAMLTELESATESGENIAVTLWRPHWAYDEYPVRDLEDPQGALGDAEDIRTYGTGDFTERYPTLTKLIGAFEMSSDQLFSLENMMFNSDEYSSEDEAARAWLEQNPTFVDDLKAAAGV
ncbi:glycine/betaine ABC transporter substrate-binding protein [Xylanimonas oleitrophica]|uniref:Glycine/betaine ABC transporter substrate-binding protein n=1 Tax=Xylanimonas oleitrophica TaxID=2607479 RepID=A0A2W5YHG0_9MICO|nr:glycine betaine ABC transporter substrate-binding protein [Xylanimonas oleitrophica]PZR54371.1 glycine/betaine ABC transporter substrate-binding protein [Xylanimonas oleitrophica]